MPDCIDDSYQNSLPSQNRQTLWIINFVVCCESGTRFLPGPESLMFFALGDLPGLGNASHTLSPFRLYLQNRQTL